VLGEGMWRHICNILSVSHGILSMSDDPCNLFHRLASYTTLRLHKKIYIYNRQTDRRDVWTLLVARVGVHTKILLHRSAHPSPIHLGTHIPDGRWMTVWTQFPSICVSIYCPREFYGMPPNRTTTMKHSDSSRVSL
jgi:hypothetical protein